MKRMVLIILLSAGLIAATGCTTVQPWERGDLSLEPMKLEDCKVQRFERNTEVYREGAIGGHGAKGAGGCGCS